METLLNELKNANKCKLAFVSICIVLLIFIYINIVNGNIQTIDDNGYSLISQNLISDSLTPVAKFFTLLAEKVFITILAVTILIVFTIRKNRNIGLIISLNLPMAALVNHTLKHIIRRPRPTGNRLIEQDGYSFPSGHSMVGLAFYGLIIYLIFKYVKNKYIKIPLIILLACAIPCIGISRIYLGVHYTSDVLAGFLLGSAYLTIYISIIEKFGRFSIFKKIIESCAT